LPNEPWERLSLFNAQAELRMLSRGGKPALLLLTETLEPPHDAWEACGEYDAEERMHILLGDPPKRARGETTQLAEVAFPAVFDYGIRAYAQPQSPSARSSLTRAITTTPNAACATSATQESEWRSSSDERRKTLRFRAVSEGTP
jgi:hypothetical protein